MDVLEAVSSCKMLGRNTRSLISVVNETLTFRYKRSCHFGEIHGVFGKEPHPKLRPGLFPIGLRGIARSDGWNHECDNQNTAANICTEREGDPGALSR